MNPPRPAALRQTWLIIFGALTFSSIVYGFVCLFVSRTSLSTTTLATVGPIFTTAGVGALIAAVAWLRFKVDGKIGNDGRDLSLSPGQFQNSSIVALALSELCTILGFMLFLLGAPLKQFAFFALGTIFVNLAFILPRGLQFWSAYARTVEGQSKRY